MLTVTNTSLARKTVVAVLHTVAFNDLDIIGSLLRINVGPDGELDTVDGGTASDDGKSGFRVGSNGSSLVEVVDYAVQEVELLGANGISGAHNGQSRANIYKACCGPCYERLGGGKGSTLLHNF